jgi:predicted branched-subunit amino acid permease
MNIREKMDIVTGGLILITLGCLISLNNMDIYGFDKSWPILLLVIAMAMLMQKVKDIGGWLILVVGIIFLVINNWGLKLHLLGAYLLPVILIGLGINILLKKRKKRG